MDIQSTYNSGGGGAYAHGDIPDYYLGCLLYYDDETDDNCRWVVYDGHNKIRCTSRQSAVDYITHLRLDRSEEVTRLLVSARLLVNKASEQLHRSATLVTGPQQLLFEQLSARLRPFVVELDNQIL